MFSSMCFCKLYDLSSLPKPKNQKLALYVGVCMLVCAFTIYRESSGQIDYLTSLDEKYKSQFDEYVKSSGFESIVWYLIEADVHSMINISNDNCSDEKYDDWFHDDLTLDTEQFIFDPQL